MQTGRMKGQAFVGLPSERVAITALEETHGYLLHGKPLVVVGAYHAGFILQEYEDSQERRRYSALKLLFERLPELFSGKEYNCQSSVKVLTQH